MYALNMKYNFEKYMPWTMAGGMKRPGAPGSPVYHNAIVVEVAGLATHLRLELAGLAAHWPRSSNPAARSGGVAACLLDGRTHGVLLGSSLCDSCVSLRVAVATKKNMQASNRSPTPSPQHTIITLVCLLPLWPTSNNDRSCHRTILKMCRHSFFCNCFIT